MLNIVYDNTLNFMLAGDEKVKEKILTLIEKMPKELKEAIEEFRSNKKITRNGITWNYVNSNEDFSLAVVDEKNQNKDYINLYLRNISHMNLKKMEDGDYEFLGYVTFFLNSTSPKERPVHLCYDCYLEKFSNNYYVNLRGKLNSKNKDNKELIEKCGYTELAESVFNKRKVLVSLDKMIVNKFGGR